MFSRFTWSLALLGGTFASASLPFALGQAAPVATGDARTVTEPSFPRACQVLQASFHDQGEDVPASVEQVSTEPDQARLQTALNSCAGSGLAVQLSQDHAGNNAFLTGPLTIPSGVTLLVDPGVTLYFSRNAQDYDTVPGTHTCGTVSGASNTASCQNLISINGSNNAAIMGYGKLNGRGGDVVLNSFPTSGYEGSTTGKTWWDLAGDANTLGGGQQNPRGIQISNATNITLYKITFKNAPNFHVAVNKVNGFTVWGMHIVTPYNARNTDGIDPGNATNVTVTQSWISDGDDNVALGANASATSNISVVNNRFFAGHGESIGSLTTQGVSNALFDNNTMYGDAEVDGSNSTAIRIKSANDRGGLVQNIQYSNSCFANHGTQVQFTPLYNSNTGTLTPNFKNILLQNLRFSSQGPVATGSFTFLGAVNGGTVNPLSVELDNVTVDTSNNLVAPSNAQITLGPGQVSSNLVSLLQPYNGVNGNVITDSRTASGLNPPACNFLFLSPALTGPQGVSQTVTAGQFPTVVVILQPAFALAQYPYPTGTVTLTDEAGRTFTATLSGTGDTTFVPVTNAPAGTHTYTASYSGDATYPALTNFGPYSVTVASGSLSSTSTTLNGVPANSAFGTPFTAVANVTGSGNRDGSVNFLVNGAVYATVPLSGGLAGYTFNLGVGSYSIGAVYAGDSNNAGSTATASTVTVGAAGTMTRLKSDSETGTVGMPVSLTAAVSSPAGTPTGTVSFAYTNAGNVKPVTLGSANLAGGVATYAAFLPQGTDTVTASYAGSANFAVSTSAAVTVVVSAASAIPASMAPVPLPYLTSTLVGGGSSNTTCAGTVDNFGDGCFGTDVVLPSGTDLRSTAADSAGNVYFTDANSAQVRRISSSGAVTRFAGYISGTACVPTATAGCTPTQVKLGGKPRGIFADTNNNLFIAGYGDNKVYQVRASDGLLYLVAGSGAAPSNTTDAAGDGGPATSALFKGPRSVATDAAGNIYIADSGDNRIREILAAGAAVPGNANVQTVAGTGSSSYSGDGGIATAATLSNPQGVAVDNNGNIYIAEGSHVRAVCVSCSPGVGLYALLIKLGISSPVNGDIYSVAGTTSSSNSKLAPGLGNTVSMGPQKLALDADGNLYIADSANNVVWFEDGRTGYTRVLAGGGTATTCATSAIGDGCAATQAVFGSNSGNGFGVSLDGQNNLYIADSTNLRIRKVSSDLLFASAVGVGSAATQTIVLHSQPGDSFTGFTFSSPDFSLGAGSCTQLSDTTQDCTYPLTFTPTATGVRSTLLNVSTALGNSGTLMVAGTATAPTLPQLISTATLTRLADGSVQAVVTVQNSGSGAAAGAVLTGFLLGSAASTSTPVSLGTIAAGASATATVTVPASAAGGAGTASIQKIVGTFQGGSFGGSTRVRLP